MPTIDQRLLDVGSPQEITENFNRVLKMIDNLAGEEPTGSLADLEDAVAALDERVTALDERVTALEPEADPEPEPPEGDA